MEEPLRNIWDQFAACDDSVTNQLYPRLASHLWQMARYKLHQHHRANLEIQDLITDVLIQHVWLKKREDQTFLASLQSPSGYLMRILLFDYQDLVKSAEMVRHKLLQQEDKPLGHTEIAEPGWEDVYRQYIASQSDGDRNIWRQHINQIAVDDIAATDESGKPVSTYTKRKTIDRIRQELRALNRNYLNGEL